MTQTPGPWILDQHHDGWMLLSNGSDIVTKPFDCSDEDARLMAAAPELLEIAKWLFEWASEDDPLSGDAAEYLTFIGAAAARVVAKVEARE